MVRSHNHNETATPLPSAQQLTREAVSYDTTYDNSGLDLLTVSCSDGSNGLVTKGYPTAGSLPDFPYIGGAPAVTGYNSAGVSYPSTSPSSGPGRC